MNEKDILNKIKFELTNFPAFLKDILKHPFNYISFEVPFDWIKILLFTFLVEAITGLIYTMGILHFSGLVSALIFNPIQTLIIISFVSFILWLLFDRLGFIQLEYIKVFKLLACIEIVISLYAVLPVTILFMLKSYIVYHAVAVVIILAKSYLLFVGFDKQFNLSKKRSLLIVGVLTLLFVIPAIGDFRESYNNYQQRSKVRKNFESQNEQSADIIKQELELNKLKNESE